MRRPTLRPTVASLAAAGLVLSAPGPVPAVPGMATTAPPPVPAASHSPAQASDTLERAVDRLFARWDRPGSPGAAVGVFRDGRTVYARGYGSAHLEWAAPITPSTAFHVASLSKPFTAYAVALLAERGALSLADDVRRHLPWVPDFGRPITLRHLLHHTSGLRDQWTLLRLAGRRLDDVIVQEDVFALVRRQRELNFPPGEEFLYGNTGYTLLAGVVERATGSPFAAWMRDEVFEPLGMSRTRFQDDHERVVEGRAASYERIARERGGSDGRTADEADPEGAFRRRVLSFATVGATGLLTSVEDLGRWVAHLDGKDPPGPEIPGARGALRRMEEPGSLEGGARLAYTLGQVEGRYRGLQTLEHGGGDAGFRSHLLRFPERRFAVAVLANLAEVEAGVLARRVADLYLSEVLEPDEPDGTDRSELDPGVAARVAGRYWNPATDEVREVRAVGGRLLYGLPGRSSADPVELVPLAEGRFRLADRRGAGPRSGPVEVRFQPPGARPEHMLVLAGRGVPAVYRAVEAWSPSAAALREYEGEYWSEELEVLYPVRTEGGGLRVLLPTGAAAEEVPLAPAVPDAFVARHPWLVHLRFLRDPEGRVAGFRASGPRVRGLLFVRAR